MFQEAAVLARVPSSHASCSEGKGQGNLVRKGWVSKRWSAQDQRAVSLRLTPQGQVLARKIEDQVRRSEADMGQWLAKGTMH